MAVSIRAKQICCLKRMLNFNVTPTDRSLAEPSWKILVYDEAGQDVISPLLTVQDLRENAVTLHLSLHSERDQIADVPAVYFVLPTQENVDRIAADIEAGRYESYHFNFLSAIPRDRIEVIAAAAVAAQCSAQISQVFDQYLNFVSLEDNMFCLKSKHTEDISYYAMNKGDVKDTDIECIIDKIVDGLYSVFVTLGEVPIIRAPRNTSAEMVAEKLDRRLRDNVRDVRNTLFNRSISSFNSYDGKHQAQMSFQRPLLVLMDRNIDLATMLHHTYTYQALIHDVLNFKLNRIEIEDKGKDGATSNKRTVYELSDKDTFWLSHKGSTFPAVTEAVTDALNDYRTKENELQLLKDAMGMDDPNVNHTSKITTAVNSLPELIEKKKIIDVHTNVATALLDKIKSRKLDQFFEAEEKLMSKTSMDKSVIDLINDNEAKSPEDKLRLFIISLICDPNKDGDQFNDELIAANCSLDAINYIKRWRSYSKMTVSSAAYTGGGTKTVDMFTKLMSQASQFAMEGVKNLVVKKHNLPVTKIVDALMTMKSTPETDDYRYFDPKLIRSTDTSTIARNRHPFNESVVFVIGGGNYIEYQNLLEYAKSKSIEPCKKNITYGATDLVNAEQFLEQLSKLGREVK